MNFIQNAGIAVGRAVYVTCVDVPSKFTKTTQISADCGGVDGFTIFALGILAAFKKHYQDLGIDTPNLDSTLRAVVDAKGFVSNVLSVPRSWKDLSATMKRKQLCSQKGLTQVAGATAKTIGLLLKMDSFGLKTISWGIHIDAKYFGGIGAKVGTSKLFVFFGAATVKGFKDKVAIVACTLKIVTLCQECYRDYNTAGKNNDAVVFSCICKCTGEVSKILFIFTAGSLSGGVIAFGVFSSVLVIAAPLYDAYVAKNAGVNFPAWLQYA